MGLRRAGATNYDIVIDREEAIGRALALAFAGSGALVVCVGRRLARLEETVAAIRALGGTATAEAADITDPATVDRLAVRVAADFGAVDLLCNNAGSFGAVGPLWEVSAETWWALVVVTGFIVASVAAGALTLRRSARG